MRRKIIYAIGHPRTTILLIAGLIILLAFGAIVFQTQGTNPEELYSPGVYFFIKILGLTDIYSSGWFNLILFGLILNQLVAVFLRFPAVARNFKNDDPELIQIENLEKIQHQGPSFVGEVSKKSTEEDFERYIEGLTEDPFGEPYAYGESDSKQFVSQQGRWIALAKTALGVGFCFVIAGAMVTRFFGLEGEVQLEEGSQSDVVRILRGKPPSKDWELVPRGRRERGQWYRADFEIDSQRVDVQYREGTEQVSSLVHRFQIIKDDEIVESVKIGRDRNGYLTGRFDNLKMTQASISPTGKRVASFLFQKKGEDHEVRVSKIEQDERFSYDEFEFQIREIVEDLQGVGPAVKLRDRSQPTENFRDFWVFAKYPQYENPQEEQTFLVRLDGLGDKFSTKIRIVSDPGAAWVLVGIFLLGVGFLLCWFHLGDRPLTYRFVWSSEKIYFVANSDDPYYSVEQLKEFFNEFERQLVLRESGDTNADEIEYEYDEYDETDEEAEEEDTEDDPSEAEEIEESKEGEIASGVDSTEGPGGEVEPSVER